MVKMAVDASIAVSVKDNFSSGIAGMKKNLTSFEKEVQSAGQRIDSLNRKKATIAVDVQRAKKELAEARKGLDDTAESAKRLENAEYNYNNISGELKAVTSEAKSAQKALNDLYSEQSKINNRASSGGAVPGGSSGGSVSGGSSGGILSALGAAGAGKMVTGLISQAANAYIGSAFDQETGTVLSSALSSAGTGAAIGTAIAPGVGTAIGAAAGGIIGAISGNITNFENKDDYFKSLVKEKYEQYNQEVADALSAGSVTAANRENSQLQFKTLLGSASAANEWTQWMQEYGAVTPFSYDDLASMSRVGLSYGFDTDTLKKMMGAIGDAGAALGIEGADLQNVATYLGRMNSSGKVTLEYLNPLIERGIPAIEYLADALTKSEENTTGKQYTAEDVYSLISKGSLDGAEAAKVLMGGMAQDYGGSMAELSATYSGKQSTLEDAQAELDKAMGEGYNSERIKGMDAEIEYLSGETGDQVKEMYSLIGEYQASLENAKEQALRDAMEDVINNSAEYKQAEAEGNGAKMGEILAAAKAQAEADYTQSEEYTTYLESQKGMIENLQDTLSGSYEDMGYNLGRKLGEGLIKAKDRVSAAAAEVMRSALTNGYTTNYTGVGGSAWSAGGAGNASQRAVGISYVPYNNFPAYLHEGERVLTASEARAYKGNRSAAISITGNNFTVRNDGDIDEIVSRLADEIEQRERLSWQ